NLEGVTFHWNDVLHKQGAPIRHVYFPSSGLLTHLVTMRDGTAEEGAIGKEGMAGLPTLLGNGNAPLELRVQVPGEGLRLPVEVLRQATQRPGAVRDLFLRYANAFLFQVQQSAACNRLHLTAQRCCRWLLTAHDAAPTDPLRLTQAGLATLLGVRRASVTEVAQVLQQDGLIRYSRGKITFLQRSALEGRSCDCYRIIRKVVDELTG
ncbi:MAG: Crp/Fnr family transcriptional regulator, partial [Gemmataceae bacterium]